MNIFKTFVRPTNRVFRKTRMFF